MKNKKGFTLIELLAVIVVLAIIALIATPIVMNTIKNAKKGAAERTADNYIKQVETTIAEKKLENNPLANGPYTIDSNGNLTGNGLTKPVTIEMNGTKPSGGTIKISNGGVSKEGTTMTVGDYNVRYKDDKLTASEPYKGVLCKANTTKVKATVYISGDPSQESSNKEQVVGLLASEATSKYDVGVTYTCELGDNDEKTFFVLETNGDNVSLIMNKNIDSNGKGTTTRGNEVAWITKEDYLAAGGTLVDNRFGLDCKFGPITAEKVLKKNTKTWTRLTESQISLPSYDQIYKAAGNKTSGLSTWLYGNLNSNNAQATYWTSTPGSSSDSNVAWTVIFAGALERTMTPDIPQGVRPVITVSKSQLN